MITCGHAPGTLTYPKIPPEGAFFFNSLYPHVTKDHGGGWRRVMLARRFTVASKYVGEEYH